MITFNRISQLKRTLKIIQVKPFVFFPEPFKHLSPNALPLKKCTYLPPHTSFLSLQGLHRPSKVYSQILSGSEPRDNLFIFHLRKVNLNLTQFRSINCLSRIKLRSISQPNVFCTMFCCILETEPKKKKDSCQCRLSFQVVSMFFLISYQHVTKTCKPPQRNESIYSYK